MSPVYYHLQYTITASGPSVDGISIAATSGYVRFLSTSGEGTNNVTGGSIGNASSPGGFFTNNTLTNNVPNGNTITTEQHPSGSVSLTLNNIGNNINVTKNAYISISTLSPAASVDNSTTITALEASFVNATGGSGATAATNITGYGINGPLSNSNGFLIYTLNSIQTETTSVFTFATVAGPGNNINDFGSAVNNCFLEGTKLYAHVHDKDLYVNIEDLREGDLVNTYLHGKKAIKFIGKDTLFNNPDKWNGCLKKFPKSGDMIDDLYITGAHSLLVDKLSEKESDGIMAIYGTTDRKIDDKFMLNAWVSEKAEPVLNSDFFTIYHLVLEHDDYEDKKYGIWANGVLTESQCEKHFLKGTNGSLKIPPF